MTCPRLLNTGELKYPLHIALRLSLYVLDIWIHFAGGTKTQFALVHTLYRAREFTTVPYCYPNPSLIVPYSWHWKPPEGSNLARKPHPYYDVIFPSRPQTPQGKRCCCCCFFYSTSVEFARAIVSRSKLYITQIL